MTIGLLRLALGPVASDTQWDIEGSGVPAAAAAAARWGGAREKRGLARGTKAVKIAQWAKVLATKSDDLSLIHPGPAWWRELFDS